MLIQSHLPWYHTVAWNGFNFIMMERQRQPCLSCLSLTHTLTHTLRCAVMKAALFAQLVPAPGEPDTTVTYCATIFTFHFSTTRSGRKFSRRYCDEITMSFSLSKELQSPGMKEPELMGEMITCHGYKNGWSSEDSLRGNWREIGFFFMEPL